MWLVGGRQALLLGAPARGLRTDFVKGDPFEPWSLGLHSCVEFVYIFVAMPDLVPEISGGTIVLVGSFNPAIFHPEWFARQKLLSPSEADAAEVKIMVPQFSHFETEKFVLQVTQERFLVSSKPEANPMPLRDLVQGTFGILEHTPVTAMGINFSMHFAMGSEERWHQVGDRLAPKEGWREILGGRPGMLSLTIHTKKASPEGAEIRAKVEPSVKIHFGVYFETNEHYPAQRVEPLVGLMRILTERWEEAQVYASRLANHVLTWTAAGQ